MSRFAKIVAWLTLGVAMVAMVGCQGVAPPGANSQTYAEQPAAVGWAKVEADTFYDGPTSGQFITPANQRTPPWVGKQPIQGVSAVEPGDRAGQILLMSDNGFGRKDNSADYVLTVYRAEAGELLAARFTDPIRADVEVEPAFHLSDPDRHIPWKIVADHATYPAGDGSVAVAAEIREKRLLTGWDFDVESFRRMGDGTFYFGDEFGPFLLHTDARGRLLGPPISLPGRWSPSHPQRGGKPINVRGSGGFEGMAVSPEGHLLPMLERPVKSDERVLEIFRFDPEAGRYLNDGKAIARYPLDQFAKAMGEFVQVGGDRYLVLERDNQQGSNASVKRVYLIDLAARDGAGVLKKRLVADLMNLDERRGITPYGSFGRFAMPFVTIESILVLDARRILVINDNNYPFSVGRHLRGAPRPDDTEFVVIELPGSLREMAID